MTKREYRQYEARVKAFFETEGITNLTASLPSEHCLCEASESPEYSEAYFSSQPCECCGTNLAGDREHATGYNPEHKTVLCYEVCQDCLYYAEYGQLDESGHDGHCLSSEHEGCPTARLLRTQPKKGSVT